MTPEEFRRHGHTLIDWIADYRAALLRGEHPVLAPVVPGELTGKLPSAAPDQAEPFEAVLRDLERLILPACTHTQDPRFFAYFPGNSALAAVLGDLASTGLAQLGLNWQASPALTELESVTTDWLRRMSGLSDAWHGVIQDSASTATLVALICAREQASGHSAVHAGLQSARQPLVVYASEQSHSSVEKAVRLAGLGRENLHAIEVDEAFGMRPEALGAAIAADRAAGRRPCAIVATTGTTATTAIDPIEPLARIARAQGLWLHVDAALAGSAMILPECRWMWAGIEAADSIVVNPHKWLGASFDCSVYFVRDVTQLVRVMSSSASYLQTAADGAARNYRDWGIPLGRRMRALKLWFLIREQGVQGLQRRLRHDLALARWLAARVDATSDWRRLAPVPLQTVCVRHEPPALAGEALDHHTLAWADRLNASGRAFLTPARVAGRWLVRVSLGVETTGREHVEALWRDMQAAARAALAERVMPS
ncbi:MAG: aspartate aminotransferase family protein [Gammaproteobacteria bacterium]|nr:aspartate aminotransferase family protein [Gammaproteobacteria bacterium]